MNKIGSTILLVIACLGLIVSIFVESALVGPIRLISYVFIAIGMFLFLVTNKDKSKIANKTKSGNSKKDRFILIISALVSAIITFLLIVF